VGYDVPLSDCPLGLNPVGWPDEEIGLEIWMSLQARDREMQGKKNEPESPLRLLIAFIFRLSKLNTECTCASETAGSRHVGDRVIDIMMAIRKKRAVIVRRLADSAKRWSRTPICSRPPATYAGLRNKKSSLPE